MVLNHFDSLKYSLSYPLYAAQSNYDIHSFRGRASETAEDVFIIAHGTTMHDQSNDQEDIATPSTNIGN